MRKRVIRVLAVIALAAVCGLVLAGCGSRVRIGTGGEGGSYYALGSLMGEAFKKDCGMNVEVRTTAGSAANLRLLDEGFVQLALAQSDVTDDAYYGKDVFREKGALKGYGAVAALYDETVHIVVPASSDIKNIEDLVDKRVSIGENESGALINSKQILQAYGISLSMVDGVKMTYNDAAEALKNGGIEAMFCTAGLKTEVLTKLAESTPVRFLSIDEEKLDILMENYGVYQKAEIPAGTYRGQDEPAETVAVKSLLLASSELSDDKVEQVTKALFEHKDEWADEIPALEGFDENSALKSVTIPFHPGAAAYYESKGITADTEE